MRHLGRVGVGQIERPDHLIVVLRVLGRRVREDENRPLAQHLVRELIRAEDLIERLLDGDAVQLHGGRTVDDLAVVGDVDAGRHADEVEDVAQAGVVEANVQRLARRGIENRLGRCRARPFTQLLDRRWRARSLHTLPDRAVERGDLGASLTVGRIVLVRLLVFAERGFELILILVLFCFFEVRARGGEHGPLERDLIVGVVGRGLHGLAIRRDRLIKVA